MSELVKLLRSAAQEVFRSGDGDLELWARLNDEADRAERAEKKLENGAVAEEPKS